MVQLGRYGLNSALCDDMGLGKTIQSLTAVLNEARLLRDTKGGRPVSLVVCPNTLTFQWFKEVDKFFPHLKVAK
jgi:SNF2 family DNA or RNA helicase